MEDSLSMTKEQFRGLKLNAKLDVLFDNQCATLKAVKGYKLYQKFTAIIGGVLAAGMGILFVMHLGGN
jgi:hypothetical protein